MARKLPWARSAGTVQAPLQPRAQSRPRQSSAAHRRSFSPGPSGHNGRHDGDRSDDSNPDEDADASRLSKRPRASLPRRKDVKRCKSSLMPCFDLHPLTLAVRTPSTSPPPAPPSESYMMDGMDNDDQYRMVEDELLAVAHTFTAHLHAAAYQRLRANAKSQTAAALRSLARPTTTTMIGNDSKERVARKTAAAKQRAKQTAALRVVQDKGKGKQKEGDDGNDADADEEIPWAGTALQGLMENDPRKARPSLVSLASVSGQRGSSTTSSGSRRPAVTNPIAQDSDDDSDDDDLDGPSVQKKTPLPLPTTTTTPPAPRPRPRVEPQRIPTPRDTLPEKRTVSFAPKTREIPPKPAVEEDQYDEDEDDDLDDDAGDMLQQLRKRRAQEKENRLQERKRRRKQKKDKDDNASMDTIPSFL